MDPDMARRDRVSTLALASAALWSAGLIAAAVLLPGGNGGSVVSTPGAPVASPTASLTLVQENGLNVLLPVGLPLLVVILVSYSLFRRRSLGKSGPGPVAVGGSILAGALCLAGALTIGPFVVPVAVLLVLACCRATSRAPLQAPLQAPLEAPLRVQSEAVALPAPAWRPATTGEE